MTLRTKKLEQYFHDYVASMPPPTEEDIEMSQILSSEQFHINVRQNTVYVENMGVIEVPDLAQSPPNPDWLAIVHDSEKKEYHIVLGHGNPYAKDYPTTLPMRNGFITAVPESVLTKYNKLQAQIAQKAKTL